VRIDEQFADLYIEKDGIPVHPNSWEEYLAYMSQPEARRVAKTQVTPEITVSTVFLSIDHDFGRTGWPVLFETMVFGGALDQEQVRYTSRLQAEQGHEAMVERVRAAIKD
jgi:hypothetical protein